jgi:hypothetical protein
MYQLLFFSKINCEGTWNCIFLVRKLHVPLHVPGCMHILFQSTILMSSPVVRPCRWASLPDEDGSSSP